MPYKMTVEELIKAKAHLELQMWYWRDSWTAESLNDMPDYIKHMYYMYGYIIWLQQKVSQLEKKYDTATMPKITNGSDYARPDESSDKDSSTKEKEDGETHSDSIRGHGEPATDGEGKTVDKGEPLSSGGIGEGLIVGDDDSEGVDRRRDNRDGG